MKYITLLAFVSLLWAQQLSAEAVVIVHKDCADASLMAKELKDMYLDKKGSWTDGTKVTIYILKSGDTHELFLDTNVKKTPSQFKAFWKKKVFTGKGRMPDEFENDAAMIKAVAAQAGSIGYVDRASVEGAAGVKILEIK